MEIKNIIENIIDDVIDIRREFHMYPELSEKEYKTQERIISYLKSWDIPYKKVADTGVLAFIEGAKPGPTIGARADIDALPICEENDLEFRSKNPGVMHACGHDVHTAIHLGLAKILKSIESEIHGNVKIFFQPAEETVGGADRMIKEGVLENPRVDKVISLHVTEDFEVGEIEVKKGRLNASTNEFEIKIKGSQGHAAYPEKSVDAIIIAANVVLALQTLVSRNVSPLNPVVLTIGQIRAGNKNNVIAGEAIISGTLRTLNEETREFAKGRLKDIAENTAKVYGGSADVKLPVAGAFPVLINDDEMVEDFIEVAKDIVGKENIYFKSQPSMGGDDFSFFSRERPSLYYFLGCGNRKKGWTEPAHSSGFKIDESCIKIGLELQLKSILKFLQE